MSAHRATGAGLDRAAGLGPCLGPRRRLGRLAVLCRLAELAGCHSHFQEGVHQFDLQRRDPGGTLFLGRQRIHARVRVDAQCQSGARLALFARRLSRLRGCRSAPASGFSACGRLPGARPRRPADADLRLSPARGRRAAADAGDARHLHRRRRSDARDLDRRHLSDRRPGLARRRDQAADRHRGARQRHGGDDDLSAVSPDRSRRGHRRRRRPVADDEPHAHRHHDPRRRR